MGHITIEVSEDLAARYAEMSPQQAERVRKEINAFAAATITRALHSDILEAAGFPQPGFALASRLAREARGDFRSAAEILREERDSHDERIRTRAWRDESSSSTETEAATS